MTSIQAPPQSVGGRDTADTATKYNNGLGRSVTAIGHQNTRTLSALTVISVSSSIVLRAAP